MADAAEIVSSAEELGFDRCGIIPVEMMSGYETRLKERMEHFPQTRAKYEDFIKLWLRRLRLKPA